MFEESAIAVQPILGNPPCQELVWRAYAGLAGSPRATAEGRFPRIARIVADQLTGSIVEDLNDVRATRAAS
jgi:hypothetical protein